jgi:YNFM family putative membrane transporter
MGALSDKYGHGRIMCLSCLVLLLGIALTTAVSLLIKILGLAAITYGFFGVHTNACAWSGQIADGDKAQVSSMYMFFYYMGASIIGSSGGWFLSGFGWNGVAAFMGTLAAMALAVSVIMTIKESAKAEKPFWRIAAKH